MNKEKLSLAQNKFLENHKIDKQSIPKILLQSSKDIPPGYMLKAWFKKCGTDWQYCWYDDELIIEFFKEHPLRDFPNIINVFKSFTNGAHRADLFRYYFLYIYGGVFVDSDAMVEVPLNELPLDKDLILTDSRKGMADKHIWPNLQDPLIFNGFMGCKPNSEFVYKALKKAYNTLNDLLKDHLYFVIDLHRLYRAEKHKHDIELYRETWIEDEPWVVVRDDNDKPILKHYGSVVFPPIKYMAEIDYIQSNNVEVSEPLVKTALVFICYNRPEYLARALEYWRTQDLSNIDVYVNLDFDQNTRKEYLSLLIEFYNNIGQPYNDRIKVNNPGLGMGNNQFDAMDRLFDKGYDFVIQAEDDVIPSNDFIHYITTMSKTFQDNKQVMSAHAFQYKHDGFGLDKQKDIYTKTFFNAWLWGTWKDRWESYFKNNWFSSDWDSHLTREYESNNFLGVYPRSTRSQNIGEYGALQTDNHDKSFLETKIEDIIYNTKTYKLK